MTKAMKAMVNAVSKKRPCPDGPGTHRVVRTRFIVATSPIWIPPVAAAAAAAAATVAAVGVAAGAIVLVGIGLTGSSNQMVRHRR